MSTGFDPAADDPAAVDATGRTFLVAAVGRCPDGRRVATDWVAQAVALGRTATVMVDADARRIRDAVLGASAGTRVMFVGPEREVMAAVAAARAAGALPSEVIVHRTTPGAVTVFCPHCATTADTAAVPGDRLPCRSCGTVLEIRPHRSSHHGSYLGAVSEGA